MIRSNYCSDFSLNCGIAPSEGTISSWHSLNLTPRSINSHTSSRRKKILQCIRLRRFCSEGPRSSAYEEERRPNQIFLSARNQSPRPFLRKQGSRPMHRPCRTSQIDISIAGRYCFRRTHGLIFRTSYPLRTNRRSNNFDLVLSSAGPSSPPESKTFLS